MGARRRRGGRRQPTGARIPKKHIRNVHLRVVLGVKIPAGVQPSRGRRPAAPPPQHRIGVPQAIWATRVSDRPRLDGPATKNRRTGRHCLCRVAVSFRRGASIIRGDCRSCNIYISTNSFRGSVALSKILWVPVSFGATLSRIVSFFHRNSQHYRGSEVPDRQSDVFYR